MKIDGIKLSTLNNISIFLYVPFIFSLLEFYQRWTSEFWFIYALAIIGSLSAPIGFFISSVATIKVYYNQVATKQERIITYTLGIFGLISTLLVLSTWSWLGTLIILFGGLH